MEHFTAAVESENILPMQLSCQFEQSFQKSYELISVLFCIWIWR